MKLHNWMAGALLLTGAGLLGAGGRQAPVKGDSRAAALMQAAARTRYTWSPEVTAVSGKISWARDDKTGAGTFRSLLHKRGGLTITADGNADVPAELKEHVASLIGHRTPPVRGAAERPPAESVIVIEDEERGPLILTIGDPMQSTQRVKDGKLVQVNRMMGGKRFTIDVTEFEKAPDGQRYYPAAFAVTWWDAATGKKVEKQVYTSEGFFVVEGQMFPKAEKVVSQKGGKTSTLDIRYSDIQFDMARPRAERK